MHREGTRTDGRTDTDGVVGTERVEGVCSTYKQTTMLAEKNLDEITALSLKKQKTKNTQTRKGKRFKRRRKSQGAG